MAEDGPRRTDRDALAWLAHVAPPLVVAALGAGRVVEAAFRSSFATLGRDQGIFQYVAWAVGQGDLAYRDVRDVNGPLVPLVHLVLQALGGESERTFRILDLVFSALAFGFAASCLVDLSDSPPRRGPAARVAWGLAGAVALGAQYLAYGYWDTAQRESFFDWFVLAGIGVGLTAHRALADVAAGSRRERRAFVLVLASGALTSIAALGKPTYALFAIVQLAVLLAEPWPIRRGLRAVPFVLGATLGLLVPFLFLVARGDVSAWLRITLHDVPTMYRFIWPRPMGDLFAMPGYGRMLSLAAVASGGVVTLVATKLLPLRALAIAAMPLVGLASAIAQAKGFPYHFHPVSAGTTLALLAFARAAAANVSPHRRAAIASLVVGLAIAVGLGLRARSALQQMPWPHAPPPEARTAEALESAEHLRPYERVDFFPHDLRRAAAFVRAHTREDERVQAYGMDAYVLFLARRRSATPFIYAYDLDVDAALAGGAVFGAAPPTEVERARIRAMQVEHARQMTEMLAASPPAAFLFLDRSPLLSDPDAVRDFDVHVPEASAWMHARYEQVADFDGIRVWLPRRPDRM